MAISFECFCDDWRKSWKTEIKELLGLHDVDFSLQLTITEVSLHLLLVKGSLMLDL
jgi:hypothetical protein